MRVKRYKILIVLIFCIYLLLLFTCGITQALTDAPTNIYLTQSDYEQFIQDYKLKQPKLINCQAGNKQITLKTFGIFNTRNISINIVEENKLYVGGLPIGITVRSEVRSTLNDKYIKNAHFNTRANCSSGIGTLTYVDKENLRFGALGHPINIDKEECLLSGKVYKCNITGVSKSKNGCPGQLYGEFGRDEFAIGNISKNMQTGIFGNLYNSDYVKNMPQMCPLSRFLVKSGKAHILTTIDSHPKLYEIQIIKIMSTTKLCNKNMIFRVVDNELLARTGGIVQGMSGSPIIQNGRLIGAITHVFVNDTTKGYGIFIDYMNE